MILSYNGAEVCSNDELVAQIGQFNGEPQEVIYRRNERTQTTRVTPAKTENGLTIGLWVRDPTAGYGIFIENMLSAGE